jgi:hypothetical protein
MSQSCCVCSHVQRDQIEKSLIGNVAYRRIGEQFQVSISSLSRHKEHVPAALLGAARAASTEEQSELAKATTAMLAEMRGFQKRLKQSRARNTPATCDLLLKISKEIRALLELRSRLLTPRMSQGRQNASPQEPTEHDDAEISEAEADQIAKKWLARRESASGYLPEVPAKSRQQQALPKGSPRDVLEDAV